MTSLHWITKTHTWPRWLIITAGFILLLVTVFLAVLAYPRVGWVSLLLVGSVLVILSLLLYSMEKTRLELKRTMKELATLNQIGQALHSSLELNNLLAALQLRVRELLGVDNFYVALYDQPKELIWYPMAVKRGQLVQWPPRALMDRLTDRVIRERQSILIPQHAQDELARIGLPVGDDAPCAWMGVPLISSERSIGCLAVFSFSPQVVFTQAELNMLVMISGQVSVAVENALLHEQVQQRSVQLETMNQITTLVTGSQNSQQVLAQVCRSVVEIGGGAKSAVYLVNREKGEIWLACAQGLSEMFIQRSQFIPLAQEGRSRCLRTGRPDYVTDLVTLDQTVDSNYLKSLQQEGIQAFADFPLVTPVGPVGYLTVYFDRPHTVEDGQARLLQTLATQAALSVSSARLHAETDLALARRADQLSILEAIGRELAAAVRSEHLFETILGYAMEFTNSRWGSLALYQPETKTLEFKAARGYTGDLTSTPTSQGISGRVLRDRQAVNLADVHVDPDYLDFSHGEACSQLCVPLIYKDDVLGVLTLESALPGAYTSNDLAFTNQLANQAAIALINARLYADLTQGRDHLAAVINSVREGLMMVEASGQVSLVNPFIQSITGLPLVELVGKQLAELPAQALDALGFTAGEAQKLVEVLGRDAPQMSKYTYKTHQADQVLERSLTTVWGEGMRPIGWLVVLRDVTEEYQLAQERELLTETLVHDLRSPIGAVLGSLEVISSERFQQGKVAGEDMVLRAVDIAQRGAQRVLGLVDSVLDIARWEAGEMELKLSAMKLGELVNEVLAEYQPQAWDYGLDVSSSIPDDLPEISADRDKVNRVLSNLLDNAMKFTPTGGKIHLFANADPGGMLQVYVRDTGPGIPEAYREKIFERFCQVPGQQGRRRGSGLGLTFCRLAVEAHGGKIWVEEAQGWGSVFVFSLPIN